MSRFSEKDRRRIRAELIEAGGELFTKFGLDRTRIKDVTEEVGIGTSTFYQFYDSKEALYIEVLVSKRDQLIERIDATVADAESPREEAQMMLKTMFQEVRDDPLISRLIVENEIQALTDRLSESERKDLTTKSPDDDIGYVEQWVELDTFRFDDPALVRDMITSLIFTTRSKEVVPDSDVAVDPGVIDEALIETIVDGLFVADANEERPKSNSE
jgi:AcrR family transcriptional regulator